MEIYETAVFPKSQKPKGDGWTKVALMRADDCVTWRRPGPVLAALEALLAWGCEHTSPRDPNSPHELLVAAREAVDAARAAEAGT